jgi:O-antigen ligase
MHPTTGSVLAVTVPLIYAAAGLYLGFVQASALMGALIVVLFFLIKFEWMFLLYLILRPVFELFSHTGIQIEHSVLNISAIMSLLLLVFSVIHIITQKKYMRLTSEMWLFMAFLMFALVSTLYHYNIVQTEGVFAFLRLLTVFCVMLVILVDFQEPTKLATLFKCLICSTFIPLVYGIWQIFSRVNMTLEDGLPRINGGFSHSNVFGAYLVIFIVIAMAWLFGQRGRRVEHKAPLLLWLACLLVCLFFTYNRGSWLALCVALLLMGLWFYPKLALATLGAGLPMLLMGFTFFPDNVFFAKIAERFADVKFWSDSGVLLDSGNSLGWRLLYWMDLLETASKSPLMGYGLGSVVNIGGKGMEAHNNYVQIFFETGCGLFFYLMVLVLFLKRAWQGLKTAAATVRPLYVSVLILICYVGVQSLNAHVIRNTVIQIYLYALFTMIICYDRLNAAEAPQPSAGAAPAKPITPKPGDLGTATLMAVKRPSEKRLHPRP